MNARACIVLLMLCISQPANAQGFAGLGTDAEGFAIPQPGQPLDFPADHGAHPAFRIEWWYLTSTLTGDDGHSYGVQWTLFRSALKPYEDAGWQSPQLWMGHAALTSETTHQFDERIARGGIGQAGVIAEPFSAWIDDWQMTGQPKKGLSELKLTARGEAFQYELLLNADTPLVLHGEAGYSTKTEDGKASYYYSQPAYSVTGTLQLPDGPVNVTGQGWLDREWSSQPLSEDQTGWDWFSLSFDSGARMMGFRLRDSGDGYTSATWIHPDGSSVSLPNGALEIEPIETAVVEDRRIPTVWQVALPAQDLNITVTALNPQSWMGTSFPYWEGPVTVMGSHAGRGYLEMTGYE
ncbi:lipocalin-like domain-containing protein [Sedimentitalea todarodis]|uniref:Lipocalin-like domain-containing protein n=1 Tax=Sedimentitalea todarodis TaxID=1631240 RepID=A0ABU3VAW7_9RHOB|nr:lipocalin-like domain-containing protein [Sedimentitalea todarodis]MDU9003312.1 lipocalin-like domain-containing protein [Sedimentitalea todarodis]